MMSHARGKALSSVQMHRCRDSDGAESAQHATAPASGPQSLAEDHREVRLGWNAIWALSGHGLSRTPFPRAFPWAGLLRPLRGEIQRAQLHPPLLHKDL